MASSPGLLLHASKLSRFIVTTLQISTVYSSHHWKLISLVSALNTNNYLSSCSSILNLQLLPQTVFAETPLSLKTEMPQAVWLLPLLGKSSLTRSPTRTSPRIGSQLTSASLLPLGVVANRKPHNAANDADIFTHGFTASTGAHGIGREYSYWIAVVIYLVLQLLFQVLRWNLKYR